MSASDDLIQAAKDMDFHGADYWSNASIEARERAKKASRELFPPMAKPLQFFNGRANGQYKVSCELGIWHASKFVQKHTGRWASLGDPVDTEQKAEAICEQHHQQTFKDQLA